MFCSDTFNEYDEREKEVFRWQFSVKDKKIDEVHFSKNLLKALFYTGSKKFLLYSNLRSQAADIQYENQYRPCFIWNQLSNNKLPSNSSVLFQIEN
jgi:hypothetical protein